MSMPSSFASGPRSLAVTQHPTLSCDRTAALTQGTEGRKDWLLGHTVRDVDVRSRGHESPGKSA